MAIAARRTRDLRAEIRPGVDFDRRETSAEVMSRPSSVSLLGVEPDLAEVLSDEQRAEAERFWLPVAAVDKGGDVVGLLEQSGAFGAIVLDGMLVQALEIGQDPTLRLIGPGSFVPPPQPPRSMPVLGARLFAPVPTRLVLLGERLLIAARRWPWIVSSLNVRMLDYSERLATQLAICQLPRVEDRIMALMWLLAESWGRVTPAGIRLPLSLSHEVLGGAGRSAASNGDPGPGQACGAGLADEARGRVVDHRAARRAGEHRAEGTAAAADGSKRCCLGGSRSGGARPGRAPNADPSTRSNAQGVRAGPETPRSQASGGSKGHARTSPTLPAGRGTLVVRR